MGKDCTFGGHDILPVTMIPQTCFLQFELPQYRKVPGDLCEGGWQPPEKTAVPCPTRLKQVENWHFFVLLLFVCGIMFLVNKQFSGGSKKDAFAGISASAEKCGQ